jgi:hypothetical protein
VTYNRRDRNDDEDLDEVFDEEKDDFEDPDDPDHDLSEWAPYSPGVQETKPWYTRRWVMLIIAALVIFGLMLPILPRP